MKTKLLPLLRLFGALAAMLALAGCVPRPPGIDPDSNVLNTSITYGPTAFTNSREALFSFAYGPHIAPVSGYQCRLDGGAVFGASHSLTLTGLADGVHTLTVAAVIVGTGEVDATPAVWTWTVGSTTPIGVDGEFAGSAGGGISARVMSVVVQGDGKCIIAGNFGDAGGTVRAQIARLNTDGSLDESFDAGLPFSSSSLIEAIAVQPDGKILVVGSFTSWNGSPRGRIARLMPDGTLDTAFATGGGANHPV